MRKLFLSIVFFGLFIGILKAQDTIVVQTLTFDSITTRRGIWEFPTENNFRKILMYHTLKCDIQTQHDQYPCGEWDYLSYNKVYIHTGTYDSTLYYHPSFTFANDRTTDSVLVSNDPVYNYFSHQHADINFNDTISIENIEIGAEEDYNLDVFQTIHHSGRSQYLWKASELTAQGLTAGDVSGIKLNTLQFVEDVSHLMIRMAHTTMEELIPDTYIGNLDTVFYSDYDFSIYSWNDFNFFEPFYWDGQSNIIIDFSFTNPEGNGNTEVWGNNPGFNCGVSSASNNYALDLDGETDFLKLPDDMYFNSDFTFETWIYKRNNNNWSRIFDFGNGANVNNVIIALSNGTSGKLSFHINNDNTNKSFALDNPTPLNEWTHVAIRLTSHLAWVYINGEFVKLGLLQQPDDVERAINYVGRSNWPNDGYADVLMDEYRLYKIALEEEEIQAHYRHEIESPESDTNLIVYFNFNEEEVDIMDLSAYGHDPVSYGLPDKYAITGPEIFLGFQQSNIRPMIQFERLVSFNINITQEQVIDSIAINPTQLVLFENLNDPTIPTDTILIWQAGKRYVYENWQIIDSILIEPDEIIYKEELPYYEEPFEVVEEYEIGRFITPYGINLDLGPQGFTWVFDVTDYAHILQGEVDLSAGNQQELIDLKFEFIEGTPPRNVLQVDRIWDKYRSYSYSSLDDDINLSAITLPLLPEAEEFKVKTRLTGHGHNSNTGEYPHCCEWRDNEHYLMVNSDTVADWHIFQYHDCGLNPVYPQGGTWPGAREGWCPGDLVIDHDFEITDQVSSVEVTLDYGITPVPPGNLGMGNGNYVIAMHLVQYEASNFSTDAEVYDVVAPGSKDYYSRKNPICYDPEIIIRNNGTSPLTSLDFEYGVSGGIPQNYSWSGSIDPHCKDTIVLPIISNSFWVGDAFQKLNVLVSNPNGVLDEYTDNNTYQTSFDLPDLYGEPFYFQLKTNNQAYRYNMQITDILGNVIIDLDNLTNNTIYTETIDWVHGCYTLELIDDEDMGLTYWAYPEQGAGYLRFFNQDSMMINNFNSDFGRSIFFTFNIGDVSYIHEPNLELGVNIFPNPFTESFVVDFASLSGHVEVMVYNSHGQQIIMKSISAGSSRQIRLTLKDHPPGLYIVRIDQNGSSYLKKIIKK